MIVSNALAFLTALTFQRFILRMLNDPGVQRAFAPDGTSMVSTVPGLSGVALIFSGSGLQSDGQGGVQGNVTNFAIHDVNTGQTLDGLLPVTLLASAILNAAAGGSGALNPLNYAAFYTLLMPFAFLQLLYSGALHNEVVEGFAGDDEISTGRGNDTYILGSGNDRVNGGGGQHDKVTGVEQPGGITADLDRGVIKTSLDDRVRVRNVEDVDGSNFRDRLSGDVHNNRLNGLDGNDILWGADGDDRLDGGRGNDDLDGGPGDDILTGGKGFDDFWKAPGEGNDVIADFEDDADALDLTYYDFIDIDEALSFAEDTPAGVVFTFGPGDSLLVEGVTMAELADDIIF